MEIPGVAHLFSAQLNQLEKGIEQSARKRHREIAAVSTPKKAIQLATNECGAELEATGLQKLPRNLDQIKNYRRTGHTKDSNVLYSVMLQCKSSQGSADAFVQDVKAAADPQSLLFFNWQLQDFVQFLTNDKVFGIFTANTTYNLGEFYVTPTTYKHLMLEDIITQQWLALCYYIRGKTFLGLITLQTLECVLTDR